MFNNKYIYIYIYILIPPRILPPGRSRYVSGLRTQDLGCNFQTARPAGIFTIARSAATTSGYDFTRFLMLPNIPTNRSEGVFF